MFSFFFIIPVKSLELNSNSSHLYRQKSERGGGVYSTAVITMF